MTDPLGASVIAQTQDVMDTLIDVLNACVGLKDAARAAERARALAGVKQANVVMLRRATCGHGVKNLGSDVLAQRLAELALELDRGVIQCLGLLFLIGPPPGSVCSRLIEAI